MVFDFTKLDPTLNKKSMKKKMIDFMTDPELFRKLVFEVIPENAIFK